MKLALCEYRFWAKRHEWVARCMAVFWLLQGFVSLWGQPQKLRFEKLSIDQGLSNMLVLCLMQDRQGFIWAGTQGGLNRFDGYRFKSYLHDPDRDDSLSDNYVNCLLEDRSGNLWVGTRFGLSRFDRRTERFTTLLFEPEQPGSRPFNNVTALAEDAQGNLWVGTRAGLLLCDPATQTLRKKQLPAQRGQHLRVMTLAFDTDGSLWMGLDAGLWRVNPVSSQAEIFSLPNGKPMPLVRSLCLDGISLWLGTSEGVMRLDKASRKIEIYRSRLSPDAQNQIAAVLKDRYGRIVVGNWRGMEILDTTSRTFIPFLVQDTPAGWYSSSRPNAIMEDRNGVFWVGTFGDGLFKYDPSFKKIFHVQADPQKPYALSDNSIYGLWEDRSGNLWVGANNDLNYMDARTGQFSRFDAQPLPLAFTLYEDRAQNLWIGARQGVVKRAPGQKPVYYQYDPADSLHRSPPPCKVFYQDKRGTLWMGGGYGLFRQALGRQDFQPFSLPYPPTDTITIYCITEDAAERLWVGSNIGLFRIAKNRQEVKPFLHDPRNPQSLSDDNLSTILVAADGTLWVASFDGGINRMDTQTETFKRYRAKDGLPNEKVWALLEDDHGRLWMSTSHGISCFDPRTERFRNYDIYDGLQGYEYCMMSAHKGRHTGYLYFGGINGFNMFHPDSLQDSRIPPDVVFTSLRYHQGSLHETEFTEAPGIFARDRIELQYPMQALVCEFSTLDYRQTFKHRYAYRLEGVHRNWIELGNRREVTFANLRPGNYTLLVKAANSDGVWNEKPTALRIVIKPPWWATHWAYAAYAVTLGLGIWYLYKRQLRRRMEKQETLRLRELDEFKSRFFTNITHEFRTPLTVILGMANKLLGEAQEKNGEAGVGRDTAHRISATPHSAPLELIRRNGENLLRLISQILDLAKLESKSLKINYTHGNIIPYLRYIAESLQPYAHAQQVDLRMESEVAELPMDYDPERLLQIIYNLLSNAIKFTPAGGSVALEVGETIRQNQPCLHIRVTDTGAGIPAEDLPYIFERFFQAKNLQKAKAGGTGIGLALARELALAMGGGIEAASELGKGSVFTVWLPIHHHAEALPEDVVWPAAQLPLDVARPTFAPSAAVKPETEYTVLLVEDNPDLMQYLTWSLRDSYALEFAHNGQEGIDKALDTVPDLIVSDVMMPVKDGFELVETLKNDPRTSHIPIVLLTARTSMDSRIAGLSRGADAYLTKPFHQEEFLLVLANMLESQRKLQARYLQYLRASSSIQEASILEERGQQLSLEDKFMLEIRSAIEQHLGDSEFSVEKLSRIIGMSYAQLNRKVGALTGSKVTTLIRQMRLEHAKELLQQGDKNISEVAMAVGFDDPKYFSRVFAEAYGRPPRSMKNA